MSELKATTIYDAYWKANSTGEGTGILVYLKSEADKVIARHKYKRCLAMADRWLFAFYATNKCNDKFYLRNLKLRELAEKFKEAK